MKNLDSQLKALRSNSEWAPEHKNAVKNRVFAVVRAEAAPAVTPSATWFRLSNLISKPLTAGTAVFALLASGWSVTASAAADSLPGDALYPVKRVGESAQLSLASLDRRAILHTEFASRRLAEAEELQATAKEDPALQVLAAQAITDYQAELQAAAEDIAQLGAENSASVVQVAVEVQQTVDQLTTLSASPVDNEQAAERVEEVQQVADRVANSIVNTVVNAHEYSSTETSERELNEMFMKRLASLETRRTFNLHRLEVIQNKISANASLQEVADLPTEDDFKRLNFALTSALARVPEVMSLFAHSGYRQSFRDIEGIEAEILAVEERIADIEIRLTQLLKDAQAGGLVTE